MSTEGFIQLPPDESGKKVKTFIDADDASLYLPVEVPVDPDGDFIDPARETTLATRASETTLASIKTGTDKIPAAPSQEHVTAASPNAARLSDGAAFYKATTPSDTQPVSAASLPLPSGAATEATLVSIKTGTDKIPTSPSQEHVTAVSPHATRLTDGTTFYKATTPSDTQPVSAASLPLPTGAATEATLLGVKTGTDKIPTSPSQEHTTAASPHAARLSDGTSFYKATTPSDTQPVSAASLPLPSGASTETTLTAINTATGNTADLDTATTIIGRLKKAVALLGAGLPAALTGSGNLKTAVSEALPTGANTIGTVNVAGTVPVSAASLPLPSGAATETTLASIKTGTDKIPAAPSQEHVTAASPHAARLSTGAAFYDTNTGAQLPAALDADGGLKVHLQNATAGSATFAEQQTQTTLLTSIRDDVDTVETSLGQIIRSTTATLSNVTASATSVQLLPANASSLARIFFNDSAATAYVKLGTTASLTSFTYRMPPFSTLELSEPAYTGRVDAIWASATGTMRVTENT